MDDGKPAATEGEVVETDPGGAVPHRSEPEIRTSGKAAVAEPCGGACAGDPWTGTGGAAESEESATSEVTAELPPAPAWTSAQATSALTAAATSAPATSAPVTTTPVTSAPARPQPLHEPDEYSTPPYGGPGPWAPAPPVQRPMATPAHGTVVPPQTRRPTARRRVRMPPAAVTPRRPSPSRSARLRPSPRLRSSRSPRSWMQYDPWSTPGQVLTHPGEPGKKPRRRGSLLVGGVLLALVAGCVGGGVGAYIERDGGITHVELPQASREDGNRAPGQRRGHRRQRAAQRGHPACQRQRRAGHRHRVRARPPGPHPHQQPCRRARRFRRRDLGDLQRRRDRRGRARRQGQRLRPRRRQGLRRLGPQARCRSATPTTSGSATRWWPSARPSTWPNTVTSGIISAKERPITAGGEKGDGSDVSLCRRAADRRADQPRQLRRPAGGRQGAGSSASTAPSAPPTSGRSPEGGQAGSIGLGFAIPINQGKRVAEELINTGRATHPVIGVTLDMEYTGDGARVGDKGSDGGPAVTAGGPGDKAGHQGRATSSPRWTASACTPARS